MRGIVSMKQWVLWSLLLVLLANATGNAPLAAPGTFPMDGGELIGDYMTARTEQGQTLFTTGLRILPGDKFISPDNKIYEITAVTANTARAQLRGQLDLGAYKPPDARPVQAPAQAPTKLIAIYHTHDDESYIPTDGREAIPGNGGIFQVGAAMAARLSQQGYAVDHDLTRHDPHDANAYQRSRRTVMTLLGKQPAALFDVHRDSSPPNEYNFQINNQPVTRILLVVGQENPTMNTTDDFVKKIKAAADAKYPGLIRGIFIAHGNYNQDLSPHAMLLEVGTQFNDRQAAERGVTFFADAVPDFLGSPAAPAPEAAPATSAAQSARRSYAKDAGVMAAAVVVGVSLYLLLSTGGRREIIHKLRRLRDVEFTNFFGPRKKR